MRHHEQVGSHAVASFPRAHAGDSAAAVLGRLSSEKPACAELVLVVDAQGRLVPLPAAGEPSALAAGAR